MRPLARDLDTPPVRSRRVLLGAAGNSMILAASGLLLPDSVRAEPDAADLPVRPEQRANRRRHRRRHRHSRNHDRHALAILALSGSQEIPSDTRMPIRFDMVLALREVATIDNSILIPRQSGTYSVNLFLTWSGSDGGLCETGVLVNDDDYLSNSSLLSPVPTAVSLSTVLRLNPSDTLQVVGQHNSPSPALVSAGAVVLEWFD